MVDPLNLLFNVNEKSDAIDFLIRNKLANYSNYKHLDYENKVKYLDEMLDKNAILLANYYKVEIESVNKYINDICNYLAYRGYNFQLVNSYAQLYIHKFFAFNDIDMSSDYALYRLDTVKNINNPLNELVHSRIIIESKNNILFKKLVNDDKFKENCVVYKYGDKIYESILLLPCSDFRMILKLRDIIFKNI